MLKCKAGVHAFVVCVFVFVNTFTAKACKQIQCDLNQPKTPLWAYLYTFFVSKLILNISFLVELVEFRSKSINAQN